VYRRLFFAFEVDAPWPRDIPQGRVLHEKQRHLTVAFLGNADYSQLKAFLEEIPLPSFNVGLAGEFDKIVFLPQEDPHVAAYHVSFFDETSFLTSYASLLVSWLKNKGFNPYDRGKLFPHVTFCRFPLDRLSWASKFHKLPMMVKNLHLYESVGHLRYQFLWTHPLLLPFEEMEHTADIAFKVRGETVYQIFINSFTALAFQSPEMINFKREDILIQTIDDIVIELNRIISHTDAQCGCSFKAVSFHGGIEQEENGILTWEMIVDV
jgi:2'-5' RNA ligase